eukprot:5613865-Pyramimonas_sp.AAC.1
MSSERHADASERALLRASARARMSHTLSPQVRTQQSEQRRRHCAHLIDHNPSYAQSLPG